VQEKAHPDPESRKIYVIWLCGSDKGMEKGINSVFVSLVAKKWMKLAPAKM